MSRFTGWLILLLAAALTYSLAFTTFEHNTGRYQTTDSGGFVRVKIECPPPVSVLFFGAQPDSPRDHGECELPSRSLLIEGVLVMGVAILVSWKAITRPKPDPIRPLSEIIRPGSSDNP